MESEIKNIIKKHGLLDCVSIVAVSGGVDSVVLLHLLQKLIPKKNLVVAHLNHGLRAASRKEAGMVEGLASKYGLSYYQKELHLKTKDEGRAREARYGWLRELRAEIGATYIITAHHSDDQLETILLNLTRGTGPLEIWGMEECDNDILRPLLSFPKEKLVGYARKHHLQYCEDKSNKDLNYARNRIRNRVTPELKAINPSLHKVVAREICLGREAKNYLEQQTKQLEKRLVNSNSIDLDRFRKVHPYLQKVLVKKMLQEALGREKDIYQKNVEAILDLITKKGNKITEIDGLTVEKTYRRLIFNPAPIKLGKGKKLNYGNNEFNGYTITLKKGSKVRGKKMLLLPQDFSDNLRVRTWRNGDKIQANFGTKKLQDVFTDAKVDRRERERWPIIVHRRKVIWVPGLQAAKIDKKSKTLTVEVK